MSRFTILCHGTAKDVAYELEQHTATSEELTAALSNAMNRIAALERTLAIYGETLDEVRTRLRTLEISHATR